MTTITREDLKQLIDSQGDYILIDVREKDELVHGMIPTAHNIPLGEFEDALDLTREAFQQRYGFDKPTKNDRIIFHCRTGGRSENVRRAARAKGYDAVNFKGSIQSWSEIDENVNMY